MTDLLKSIAKTFAAAVASYAATVGFDVTPEMQAAMVTILVPVLTGVANALAERFPTKLWPAPMYLPVSKPERTGQRSHAQLAATPNPIPSSSPTTRA